MWELNGVEGAGNAPPPIANGFGGLLTIMGGAECIWKDMQGVAALFDKHLKPEWNDEDIPGDIMAVNDIGAYWQGKLRHWVTLHGMYMAGWRKFRMKHNFGAGSHVHTHSYREPGRGEPQEGIDIIWDIENVGGTSGLFACRVAFALGYSKIILAGIPMDNSRHFFDAPWYGGVPLESHPEMLVWVQARDECFNGRVRSMSGRTKMWLGEPTKEWLEAK